MPSDSDNDSHGLPPLPAPTLSIQDRWFPHGSRAEQLARRKFANEIHIAHPERLVASRLELLEEAKQFLSPYHVAVVLHALGAAQLDQANATFKFHTLLAAQHTFHLAQTIYDTQERGDTPNIRDLRPILRNQLHRTVSTKQFISSYEETLSIKKQILLRSDPVGKIQSLLALGRTQLMLYDYCGDIELLNEAHKSLERASDMQNLSRSDRAFLEYCRGRAYQAEANIGRLVNLSLAIDHYYIALNSSTDDQKVLQVRIFSHLAIAGCSASERVFHADPLHAAVFASRFAHQLAETIGNVDLIAFATSVRAFVLSQVGLAANDKRLLRQAEKLLIPFEDFHGTDDADMIDLIIRFMLQGNVFAALFTETLDSSDAYRAFDSYSKTEAICAGRWPHFCFETMLRSYSAALTLLEINQNDKNIWKLVADKDDILTTHSHVFLPFHKLLLLKLRARKQNISYNVNKNSELLYDAIDTLLECNLLCETANLGEPENELIHYTLGLTHFKLKEWRKSIENFRWVTDYVHHSLLKVQTRIEKRGFLRNLFGVGDRLAYACIQVSDYERAWREVMQSRAVLLSHATTLEILPSSPEGSDDDPGNRISDAAIEHELEAAFWANVDDRTDLDTVWQPQWTYLATPGDPPGLGGRYHRSTGRLLSDEFRQSDWARWTSQAMPDGGILVAPIQTNEHGGALLLQQSGQVDFTYEDVVLLEGLTEQLLKEIVYHDQGWLSARRQLGRAIESQDISRIEEELAAFDELFGRTSDILWEEVMGPLSKALEDRNLKSTADVIIMASGLLSVLPLHAARRQNEDGHWRYFLEDWTVSNVPSPSALIACHRRLRQRSFASSRMLSILNPTRDLPYWESPCWDLFSPDDRRELLTSDAVLSAVCDELPHFSHLSFFCHGEWHPEKPLRSGLILAGDDGLLTLEKLQTISLESSRIAILGACESGLVGLDELPDELIGLPGAFIEAGLPAVLSSQWQIDADSTFFLISRFLELQLKGQSPARALKQTQIEMLHAHQENSHTNPNLARFSSPFHWAGFTLTGL